MADLTAHFRADFSDFSTAVHRAEVELKSFEADANKVEGSLTRMADAFSGRKVIQEATLMVEAVERVGGATKLTEAEFAKLHRTVTAASDKMKAMGVEVPASFAAITAGVKQTTTTLDQFGLQTVKVGTTATNTFATLGQSIGQVDRIAALVGVRLGPLGGALSELGTLATLTGTAFGMLGPAVGVAAAAFATFKVGELVRDYTSLDEQIIKLTEHTFGWGTASKYTQEQLDTMKQASVYAKTEITDLGQAMTIVKGVTAELAREQEALAAQEQRIAEHNRDLAQSFAERFRAASAERDKAARAAAEAERTFTNQIETQRIADHAAALAAQEEIDRGYRNLQNQMGELYLKAEGERLQQEAEAHAAMIAAKIKAEEAFFQKELGGGMKIIGAPLSPGASELERPQSLLTATPLNQRGVALFGGPAEGMPAAGPTINQTFNINGTGQEVAHTVTDQINQTMSRFRKFGSS